MKQLSASKERPRYRLSPNEVEKLKKEETERRRKLRIVQVREQSKEAAAKIRNDVKQERKRQIIKLAEEIEGQLEDEKQEEIKRLEQRYDNTLRSIGQGHTQASIIDKKSLEAERQCAVLKNRQRAEERHKEAVRRLALDKAYKEYEETKHIRDRQAALVEEKKRASEIAARPPPPPDPINDALLERCQYKKSIPMTDLNAFSSTHYHIPDFAVEKAPPQQQQDAIRAGEEEDFRTKEEVAERKKKQHDQIVRARIRGSEALKKELLKHDYEAMMTDLSLQQRADRRHRQQVVSKLPKQVFLPPDRRLEELQEKQLEMERAFEDLYTRQMNISGDLSLILDPNPIPNTPVEGDEESRTESPVVTATIPAVNPALREVTNLSRSAKLDTQQGQPESVLKKLLNRIKEQRSEAAASTGQKELVGQAKLAAPADSGPAARPPVAKPAPDPELDLSPLRAAPGNQKPQKSPVKPSPAETETDDSEVSADTEASFLEKLKDRIHNIEAQQNVLDQKMREQLQQPALLVPSAAELPAQSSGFSLSTEVSTMKLPTTRGNLPRSAGLPTVTSEPVTTVTSLPRTTALFAEPASLVSGPLDDVPVKSTDLWKKTEYGQNVRQETSGESTLASGLSTQQVSFQSHTSAGLYRARPNHFDYLTSSIPAPLASQMPTTAPFLPAQLRFISAIVPVSSSVVVGGQTSSHQKGQTGDRGLVDVGVSVGYPISSLPAPYSTSSAFVSVASGSLRSQPFLSSALGSVPSAPGLQPQLSSLTGPLSALTSQSGSLAERLRASVGDAGDGRPSTIPGQSERLQVDYGLLAERLAIGLPEQDRLLRVKEYQRHLVEKHQERIKTLQEVRARIEARQASSTLQQTNTPLPASLQLPNPALIVPYTLKTSHMQSSSSSLGTSSSLFYHGPGAKPTERPGFGHAQEEKTAAELVTAGEASSSGLSGTTVSSVIFTAAEPILAGSTGFSAAGFAGLLKNMQQPFSYSLALKSQTDQQMQADALEKMSALAGSRRSSGGSSNRLDDVRKSLPFDNPDDTLHRNDGDEDAGGLSVNDDSHLSSSTDRGSPSLGSHSYKSFVSAKPETALSEGSLKLLGRSSLAAMAQEKRINFEKQQEKLRDQLANIQRQKDILLQHYQGNWQQISTREEDLRLKLKSAQALSSSSSAAGTAAQQVMPATLPSIPDLPVPAKALSLGVWQSCSPSMELEEKSLQSDLGDRASLSSQRTGGSTARSWAMELEEFSIDRSQGNQGAAAYQSPGNMTVEELSMNSDFSKGKEGLERGTEKTVSLKYGSSDEPRPLSSLSSLEEYPIDNSCSRSLTDLKGMQEASQEDVPSKVPYKDSLDTAASARDLHNLRDLMADLLAAGSYFSQAKDGEFESSARAAQPPTRQPATVAGYQPHGLSTILEVDTPQTATRSTATNSSRLLSNRDVTEKPLAKRFIDFNQQSISLPEGAVFSADEPLRGHAMHTDPVADVGLVSAGSSRRSGTVQDSSEKIESSLNAISGFTTVTDTGDHQRPPREVLDSSSTHEYQPLELTSNSLISQPASSSTQEYIPLELTSDCLTSQSLSWEECQILPSERSQGGELFEVNRGYGDCTRSAHLMPAHTSDATTISQFKVDSVMTQAQQFSSDLLQTIQRRAADVFDQSGM